MLFIYVKWSLHNGFDIINSFNQTLAEHFTLLSFKVIFKFISYFSVFNFLKLGVDFFFIFLEKIFFLVNNAILFV